MKDSVTSEEVTSSPIPNTLRLSSSRRWSGYEFANSSFGIDHEHMWRIDVVHENELLRSARLDYMVSGR